MTSELPTSENLHAWAKLTLSLRVVGRRNDGMHLIDAEMVTLDLHDQLVVTPAAVSRVSFRGDDGDIPTTGDDLVAKALSLAGVSAEVAVTKHIHAGAGLGGGSADAAAILRWAGFENLERAADELGADVAFCMVGGRAQVSGIGEVVKPLAHQDRVVTLLTPPIHCPSGAVYQAWDKLPSHDTVGTNDLEPAALHLRPALAQWRDQLGNATGRTPQLAGSGSTWFVEGNYPGGGRVVARTVPALT